MLFIVIISLLSMRFICIGFRNMYFCKRRRRTPSFVLRPWFIRSVLDGLCLAFARSLLSRYKYRFIECTLHSGVWSAKYIFRRVFLTLLLNFYRCVHAFSPHIWSDRVPFPRGKTYFFPTWTRIPNPLCNPHFFHATSMGLMLKVENIERVVPSAAEPLRVMFTLFVRS
jgi:hypothetical protein